MVQCSENSLALIYRLNLGLDIEYDPANTLFAHLNTFEYPIENSDHVDLESSSRASESMSMVVGVQLGYKRKVIVWGLEQGRLLNIAQIDGLIKGYSFKSQVLSLGFGERYLYLVDIKGEFLELNLT